MHDTYLLNKISKSLDIICQEHNLKSVRELTIVVNLDSHINEESLKEHLLSCNMTFITTDLQISLIREDIEAQNAIIKSIQGETI